MRRAESYPYNPPSSLEIRSWSTMRLRITLLLPLLLSPLIPLVVAQSAQTTYTIHVDFYMISCSLDIQRVSLYDQSGQQLAVSSSPYGGEIAITFRAPSASIQSVTAIAFGQATLGSYYSWTVSGSRTVVVGSGGDYWIMVGLS